MYFPFTQKSNAGYRYRWRTVIIINTQVMPTDLEKHDMLKFEKFKHRKRISVGDIICFCIFICKSNFICRLYYWGGWGYSDNLCSRS